MQVIDDGHVEEMSLGFPRKIQDNQVAMSESAGNTKRGKDAWTLEPEGVMETLETKVVSKGVGRPRGP